MGHGSHQTIPEKIKDYPILSYMWQLVHRYNSNFILLIVGLPGKGKSYAALTLLNALMINHEGKKIVNKKNFLNHLGFTFEEFSNKVEKNNRKGSIIIWEEAATIDGANARRFYDEVSIYMSSLFQTMRYKNQIAILTLPSGHYLDKQLRQICHATLNMEGHDDIKSWGKFKLHSFNPELNKLYSKYPRFYDSNHNLNKITKVFFPKPPKWMLDIYEEKQQAWKNELQKKVNKYIAKKKLEEGLKDKSKLRVMLDITKNRWQDFYDNKKNKFVPELIMDDEEIRDIAEVSLYYAQSIARTLKIKKDKGTLY